MDEVEDGGKWAPWTERIAAADIPKDMPFHEIIVENANMTTAKVSSNGNQSMTLPKAAEVMSTPSPVSCW